MIAPMKRVSVIVLAYEKKSALRALRKAGIVHIDDVAVRNERLEDLTKSLRQLEHTQARLKELEDAKGKKAKAAATDRRPSELIDSEEFSEKHARVMWLIDQQRELEEHCRKTVVTRDMVAAWGDFSPEDMRSLANDGIVLHLYRLNGKEIAKFDGDVDYIRLSGAGKSAVIATVGSPLPDTIVAEHLELPEHSCSELSASIQSDTARIEQIRGELIACTTLLPQYSREIAQIQQDIRFETVSSSMGTDDTVAWLSGYIPAGDEAGFKKLAADQRWGYAIDDPAEEEEPPTLVRNKRWISIISPVFDLLGTVPGYREYDISMWFLLFFTLFFAMIVGDAAYGVIFLLVGILLHRKSGKATNIVILLYVFSIASIAWGALTGTWFGSKEILEAVPFLQRLVIPQIANYPELFGVSANSAQNNVMRFCFILGTLQLSLARIMNIHRKIGRRDLSAVADAGWLIMIDALYFLVLMLVINETINVTAVGTAVGIGFVLVVLFGAQGPSVPFLKGLAGGAANFFTTFLDSISAFSNIISYIRLFAVGMASLAIAQSFNNMASGLLHGFALPAGILVLVIGHALNLVMALLSVIVHGVRLNLLEFAGQLGMEWTGHVYDPFRETVETSSHTL